MVRAWYMAEVTNDKREPNMLDPHEPVTLEKLEKIGVSYWQMETEDPDNNPKLKKIRQDHHYDYEDIITCSREKLQDYDKKLEMFFVEHLHSDDEIRFITDGSGYFDIRDPTDRWIRIEVVKGDMIVVPAGIYHRFTLDTDNFITARRYFVGEPVWKPYNRPSDDHEARKTYLQFLQTVA